MYYPAKWVQRGARVYNIPSNTESDRTNHPNETTNLTTNITPSNRAPSYVNNTTRETLRQALQQGKNRLTDGDIIAALHTGKQISINRKGVVTRLRLHHGYLEKSTAGGPWAVAHWLGLELWRKGHAANPPKAL